MSEADPRDERAWEVGWDGHAMAQRRRRAALPLMEKLRWLEEAQELVEQLRHSRVKSEEEKGG